MSISQADIDAMLLGEPTSEKSGPSGQSTAATAVSSVAVQPTPMVTAQSSGPRKLEVQRILDLSVPVAVVLAQRDMPVATILEITVGTILEFEALFDSELSLEVASRSIGAGQAVKVGENYGLRVTKVGTMHDRIDAMGGL